MIIGSEEKTAQYPVLIIPGYGAPAFQTEMVSRRLREGGLDTVKLKLPWMAMGDMTRAATLLSEEVERVQDSLGYEKVNFFGYSLGGIVARYYLQELEGYPVLGRGAFVSTPIAGTYFGYLGFFSPAGRQIRPASPVIKVLNERRVEEIAGKCLSIYIRWDGVIIPHESAYMADGYNIFRDRPVLHWRALTSRETIMTAAEFLRGGLPEGAVPGHELLVGEQELVIRVPAFVPRRTGRFWSVAFKPFATLGSRIASAFRRDPKK